MTQLKRQTDQYSFLADIRFPRTERQLTPSISGTDRSPVPSTGGGGSGDHPTPTLTHRFVRDTARHGTARHKATFSGHGIPARGATTADSAPAESCPTMA